ncbi:MAG: hypothetical protein IJ678_04750, partial [Kiritimatiellae bacterium]|nr:hypothetical protein [Kiritimatiellia bacterium]
GAEQQDVAAPGHAPAPGGTVYAVARMYNARTGREDWSLVASYAAPEDSSAPELVAWVSEEGYKDAEFSFRAGTLGAGATAAAVSVAVYPASADPETDAPVATVSATATADGWTGSARTPYALSYNTAYVAVATIENNASPRVSGTPVRIAFRTKAPASPSATMFASEVAFTRETVVVDVADMGTDAASATVTLEFSADPDFADGVETRTAEVSSARTVQFVFDGLSDGTDYYVRGSVVNSVDKGVTLPVRVVSTPAYSPPWFGVVGLAENWPDKAVVSVPVSALGAGTEKVRVQWSVTGPSGEGVASGALDYAAAGAETFALDGLVPGSAYSVALRADGDHEQSVSTTFSFSTPLWLVALGEHSAEVSTNGTLAALSANVVRASQGSTVVLSVNGSPVNEWKNVASGQTVSWNHAMALGTTNVYSFVAADASGGYTDSVSGSFIARRSVGWFAVDWAADGYGSGADWKNAAAEAASGGEWSVPDEEGATFELVGGALDVRGGEERLRFAA